MTDRADDLAVEILALIDSHERLTNSDRIRAAMMVIADIVGAIDCRQCRETARQSINELLPECLQIAMERPALGGTGHVH